MDKFKIIQDTREQRPLQFPDDDDYSEVIVAKLDTGDYAIDGLQQFIAIDRKGSVGEFATNVVESRFKDVLKRMSESKYKFFVCEFDMQDIIQYPVGSNIPERVWKKLRIGPSFLLSIIAQIQVNYGIHFVFAGDHDNAAQMVLKILKRIWKHERT